MAIKGNVGNVEVAKDIKLYTGIVGAQVLAINPSLEEINSFGVNFQNAITYTDVNNDGNERVRIDVWFKCTTPDSDVAATNPGLKDIQNLVTKVSFFLSNRFKANNEGTKLGFINNFGQNAWAEIIPDATEPNLPSESWFRTEGIRQAYDGEDVLINFIRNWVNAGKNDEMSLDNVKDIILGKFGELQSLVPTYKNNVVRIMLTVVVKDNKYYQSVYNRFFARWNHTSPLIWRKYIQQDKYNKPKGPWSYVLTEYKPTDMPVVEEVPDEEVQAQSNKW